MADFNFDVSAGDSLTLLTAGKYCRDNIVVNAIGGEGGGGGSVDAPELHTVTEALDNADEVVKYFRNLRPSGCNDMIIAMKIPDGITAFSKFENGQMLALLLNGTKAAYARWYSSAVNVQTTFTTSYTCKCWAGDEYYLLPLV